MTELTYRFPGVIEALENSGKHFPYISYTTNLTSEKNRSQEAYSAIIVDFISSEWRQM